MKIKELQSLLKDVVQAQQDWADSLRGSDNPITVREQIRIEQQLEAFQAVLHWTEGDEVPLKCYR